MRIYRDNEADATYTIAAMLRFECTDMNLAKESQFCKLSEGEDRLVQTMASWLNWSVQAYHQIVNLVRLVADLTVSNVAQLVPTL